MRPPTCCICTLSGRSSTRSCSGRVARTWPRRVSLSCPTGCGSTVPAGQGRTSAPTPSRSRCDNPNGLVTNPRYLLPPLGFSGRIRAAVSVRPCRGGAIFAREHGARTGYYRQWGRLILCGRRGLGMNSLTAVSEVKERAPRVLARFGRGDGDRAFRTAVRHSRHVRVLRLGLRLTAPARLGAARALSVLVMPLGRLPRLPLQLGQVVVARREID